MPADEYRAFFGPAWSAMCRFAEALQAQGEELGLIGPREAERLWERHLLNSAAVIGFLPASGLVIDLGSGAGLPGLVLAAMRPALTVELVEPMARRTSWLEEMVGELGLTNVTVVRARAEDLAGKRQAAAVTARAVAPLGKLAGWSSPILANGGVLIAQKGRRAWEELTGAKKAFRQVHLDNACVHEVIVHPGQEPTWIVTAHR